MVVFSFNYNSKSFLRMTSLAEMEIFRCTIHESVLANYIFSKPISQKNVIGLTAAT